jgi:hypothetical protein
MRPKGKQMEFVNELGNKIRMEIAVTPDSVTVIAEGPTSLVEHTWTPMEARILRELLLATEPMFPHV